MNVKLIKVSIIIPVYNTEKYLRRCIDSILKQTLNEIEIIIINDASSDNSNSLLRDLLKKDERIVVISNKSNRGALASRLIGCERARGVYLGFVDSDDYVEQKMYEKLYLAAIKNNADIVCSDYFMHVASNSIHKNSGIPRKMPSELFGKDIFEKFLSREIFHVLWNKLFHHSLYNKCKPFFNDINYTINVTEDMVHCLPMTYYAKHMIYINKPLYHYLYRESSSLNLIDFDSTINHINYSHRSFGELKRFLVLVGEYDYHYKSFQESYFREIKICLKRLNNFTNNISDFKKLLEYAHVKFGPVITELLWKELNNNSADLNSIMKEIKRYLKKHHPKLVALLHKFLK